MATSRPSRALGVTDLMSWTLFALTTLALAALARRGWHYYGLPIALRREAPLHLALRPSGSSGHAYGIVGTVMMLTNLLYLVRRRFARVEWLGSMRAWLRWHVFSGFAGLGLIALHSAMTLRSWPAVTSTASLVVVIASGLVGRYLYALVPHARNGTMRDLDELRGELDHALMLLRATGNAGRASVDALESERSAAGAPRGGVIASTLRARWHAHEVERTLIQAARHAGGTPDEVRAALRGLHGVVLLNLRVEALSLLERAASTWRSIHRTIALVMLVAASLHVSIAVYLGYGY